LKIKKLLKYFLELHHDTLHEFGNKTANITIKNCSIPVLTAMDKTAEIIKKAILLSITLTFRRCDGG